MDVDIRLLGDLRVRYDGTPLALGSQRRLCLLAVLLLNRGRTVSRAELAEWAWPSAPDTVDRQIANYVSALRRGLGPAGSRIRLLARQPGFTAQFDPGLLDTERFAALVGQARTARAGHEHQIAADRLKEALGLWHGHALNGLDTPYLRRRTQALEAEQRAATMLLAEIEMEAGRPAEAVSVLRDLAARQDDEAVTAALVRALTGTGHTAEAAKLASRASGALLRQGRTPTAALRQAHSDALAGRVPNAPVPLSGPRHQLPTDTRAFTGREDELAELVRVAKQAQAGQSPGTVMLCVLHGMAGVGKTALAVHAAHSLADEFPDGQLFVDLHGWSRDRSARDPADALAMVLQALGVAPQRIPAELDARAALYRERLAGTRTLILLDNAAGEAQVRPLLPASDQCLVLITSRRRFKALDDAHTVALDLLPVADAIALFRTVAGADRAAANDPLLEEVVTLCDRLPLALRIAAALVRASPAWNLERLADRLRERRPGGTLDGFSDGDRSLAAVFDLSLRTLDPERNRLFGWLGLIPGPDTDAHAAAALLAADPAGTERLLQDLVDLNLLSETTPGRYRMHDLVRRHARTLAGADPDSTHRCAEAMARLLDYYQYTAMLADARSARHTRAEPSSTTPASTLAPAFSDPDSARSWLRAERANLLAAIEYAADGDHAHQHAHAHAHDERVVALSAGLAGLLRTDGPWTQAIAVHTAALAAAERLGDQAAQAGNRTELGALRRLTGDYPEATKNLQEALRLYRGLGDRRGQASVLTHLGTVQRLLGDYPGAAQDLDEALGLYRDLDDRPGQADALTELGAGSWLLGDYPGATRELREALALYRELDDPGGQSGTLTQLATVQVLTGDYQGAERDLEACLILTRELGNRLGQANALTQLGNVRRLLGDGRAAVRDLEAALDLFQALGNRRGQANALVELGVARRAAGDPHAAARDLEAALELCREIGSRGGEAYTLNHYAAVFTDTGDRARALTLYREALELAREVRQPDDEALALEGIGECLLRDGDGQNGVAHLNQALTIFRRLAMQPGIDRLTARLAGLGEV